MAVDLKEIQVGPGLMELDPDGTPLAFDATVDGMTISYSRDQQLIEIDEAIGPVDAFIQGENLTVKITANQHTASRLKAAFGHGTITTTPPGAGTPGSDLLSFGGDTALAEYPLRYTAKSRKNPNLNIIIDFFRVVPKTDGDIQFGKKTVTGVPITFQVLEDLSKPAGQQLGTWKIETAEALP